MRTLRGASVKGKRVLIRVDFNLPPGEDFDIERTAPTIRDLLRRGAKVLLVTHLGRPGGKRDSKLSTRQLLPRIKKAVRKNVAFVNDCLGERVATAVRNLKPGGVMLLENVRFYSGEEKNDSGFAKKLAENADLYLNEAFGASHRTHASIVAVTRFLPSYAGPLFEKEVRTLSRLTSHPSHPLVVVIGGAKVETKLPVVGSFLKRADHVLLGGVVSNVLLAAKGLAIGRSPIPREILPKVKRLPITSIKLHLPVDVATSPDRTGRKISIHGAGNVPRGELILDIGPDTRELFSHVIEKAKTIFWNGAMGLTEVPAFADGTRRVAEAIARSKAEKVVGGGDLTAFLRKLGLLNKMGYVSTGGGAMLEFLAERKLPGVVALDRSAKRKTQSAKPKLKT